MATEYSIQKMVSDGTLSTIALGIQYLQRNDIYIRIAGEETPQSGAPSGYTWSFLDNTTLKILPVLPNGVEVVVYRRTDVDVMYNIYSQNAQFDEATIDENNVQLLYIAQEYLEQGATIGVDDIEYLWDDGYYTYYRIKRTDGSYGKEFKVPSAGTAAKVLAREALRRSYAEAGYNLVSGSFQAGFTLVNANDVALDEATGKVFSGAAGTYPAGTSTTGFVDSSANLLSAGITDFADSTYADMVLAITTPVTDHINVATWNIWSYRSIPNYYNHDWATTEKISDTVAVTLSEAVHIFGLQETLIPLGYEDDFLSRGFYSGINVRNRTDRLGYGANPKTPLAYGNAILSSLPILETGGGNFAVQSAVGDEQGWALTVVDIGGDEVAFYCCHATSLGSEMILAHVQEMADIAAADPRSKVVVVGDFNTGDSGCQALVDSGLTMLNADGQYNTNNVGGTWYIDRIFYRGFSAHGNLRALSQPEKLGDHKPFFATLYI